MKSNVIYSSKFRRVLSKMDDTISKILLEVENKELDIIFNFIDVKVDNENVLTFTPDKISQEFLKSNKEAVSYDDIRGGRLTNNIEANGNIFTQLGYVPKSKESYCPDSDEVGEVISKFKSEKSGKVWCYVKFEKGEGVYNESILKDAKDKISKLIFKKSRQEIRIGRAVRALLSASNQTGFSDSQIEKFVNNFRAVIKIMNDVFSNFEIVEGDDLLFWYHRRNYLDPRKGNLGSSCQAVGRKDWLEIYIKNPETVKLVILRSEEDYDKIIGRSLLWKLDDGSYLMDRIYTANDSGRKIFMDYANHKGWYAIENEYTKTYFAHVKPMTFDKYPSIDNMNNWDPSTGKISNRSFNGSTYITWSNDGGDDEDEIDNPAD